VPPEGPESSDSPESPVESLESPAASASNASVLDEDGSGVVQVLLRNGTLGAEKLEFFKSYVDLGDVLQVSGSPMRTRTGEVTVQARELHMLSKSLRPLPEKWHGLQDVETRYRQRYVDLVANPPVGEVFRARSHIVRATRNRGAVSAVVEGEESRPRQTRGWPV